MKREIKFRGKRLDTGEWMNDMYTLIQDADGAWLQDANECQQIDPDTLGQFTGLLDKNRRGIYEGDILGFSTERKMGYLKDGVEIALSVIFGRANPNNDSLSEYMGFWTKSSFGNCSSISYQVESHGAKVIGNIHDNPELLKGGKE